MNEILCRACGNRNPAHTQFCNFCGSYLGWADDQRSGPPPPGDPRSSRTRAGRGPAARGDATHAIPVQPRPVGPPRPPGGGDVRLGNRFPGTPFGPTSAPATDAELRVEVEQQETTVVIPGAPPSPVSVHIANTSTVVEAYRIMPVKTPPWLIVTQGHVRLLPGTDERVQVTVAIAANNLVPVHRFQVVLRVQGESSQGLYRDVAVDVAVGEVVAPAQLRLEPTSVRTKDATTARFRVLLDNRRSNVPMRFDLTGRDPEQAARFTFEPAHVEVPPGGSAYANVRVDAPLPPAGEQLNRTLTVVAVSGTEELTANAGFTQAASAIVVDPPVVVRLDPSVVHANRRKGVTRVVVDNRRGSRPQRIYLEARDVENVVRFRIVPQHLEVGAGRYTVATVTMQAPRPEAGEEASRSLIVAAWDGNQSIEAQGQLVQETAARRPFMRVLLTLLGGIAMIVGSFLPWTVDPAGTGMQWNYPIVPNFLLRLNTEAIDTILAQLGVQQLVSALVTAGGLIVFFGVLAMLGLFGTGKLIRTAAVLGIIVLLLFLAAAIAAFFVASGFPGLAGGWLVALVGCVLAFIGSHFARA